MYVYECLGREVAGRLPVLVRGVNRSVSPAGLKVKVSSIRKT